MNPDQIKQAMHASGITIREFARVNGFSEGLVYAVLANKVKANRGESYRIAIALGLKTAPQFEACPTFIQKIKSQIDSAQTK